MEEYGVKNEKKLKDQQIFSKLTWIVRLRVELRVRTQEIWIRDMIQHGSIPGKASEIFIIPLRTELRMRSLEIWIGDRNQNGSIPSKASDILMARLRMESTIRTLEI